MEELKGIVPKNPKGNSDVITREYLDSLCIEECLIGSTEASTETNLFGKMLKTPIMTGAISGIDRFHENGTVLMAEGIKAAGSVMWMGISEEPEIERAAATGVPLVEIIKPYADNETVLHKIEHARKCGLTAVGMDIDHSFAVNGYYGTDRLGNPMSTKTEEELKMFVEAAGNIPFIVKGVLSVKDALASKRAGAAAVVLSHHHNIYPFAVPPLKILPEIRNAVGSDMTIIVDSMIHDGYDSFKAIALGADGVCVGRSLQLPLAEEGADGVEKYITEMTDQLRGIMSRTGSKDLKNINSEVIVSMH